MSTHDFSNFGSLKSTETCERDKGLATRALNFSNFGSLKSTETGTGVEPSQRISNFSNFGSLKSTETGALLTDRLCCAVRFQQFRLVEEH